MNAQKFTQKSLEAIQEAQNIALEHNSMQIEQEHLVCALLEQKDGLIPQLMKKMGTDPDALLHAVEQRIEGLPGVTGPGRESGKIYVSGDVDQNLAAAEREAGRMKDEYVSVEHIMMAVLEKPNTAILAQIVTSATDVTVTITLPIKFFHRSGFCLSTFA